MDSADLSPALLKAGQKYLDSLRRLRLQPQGLLWSRLNKLRSVKLNSAGNISEMMADSPTGDWHLILITSAIDEGGPSALNELLFKAYDASATPQEISPFIVEVMSDKSPFVQHLLSALNNPTGPTSFSYTTEDGRAVTQPIDNDSGQTLIGGMWFDRKWIYYLTGLRERNADRKRHWREFKQSVNALAA
ncbi:hypothetical protein [Rhizobium ruizarguesonis]|uniref:hypothetical protein n=1 Tax=Rhizobium ruizarguesonis TaxID=2081791 RepID=UPI0010307E8B|nr:hypothetical protein [Rhizobium ruizarguesonis]TBE20544.1 hypothetical protein ELH05_28240 [Rhizobium ruizarguesonis]TCA27796.1 hypothetical protein E0H66_31850 [Rhizobium leguminosarum bv. viciae]WSH23703.1 hypothetical protein U8Q07_25675 [Rhizobium ruizarguesonis]WSH37099.1 hypothetical protein U8P70_28520 [Rhizobium ruizarguesonis]